MPKLLRQVVRKLIDQIAKSIKIVLSIFLFNLSFLGQTNKETLDEMKWNRYVHFPSVMQMPLFKRASFRTTLKAAFDYIGC